MKKYIKIISIIWVVLIWTYFAIYLIQNYQIKKSLEKFNKNKLDNKHALIRCNWNIFEPEFAYVFFDNEGNISFDKQNQIFWDSEDWRNSSIGGTTIQNTTFAEFLAMVKEDCYQFQKPKGNYNDKTINWRWVEAEEPKSKTQEEIEWEKKQKEYTEKYNKMSEEEKRKLQEEVRKQGEEALEEVKRLLDE